MGLAIDTESMNDKSGHSLTEMHGTQDVNPVLKTEETYSTVTHEVFDLKEKQPESQTVMNTTEIDQGSSNLTHKVSQSNKDFRTSIVAHKVQESKEKTNLPVNPILNQGEIEANSSKQIGDDLDNMKEDQTREEENI